VSRTAAPTPEELGRQIAYLALEDGTLVYDREGTRIGVVEHVMAVDGIFEGVIIHTYPLPGRHLYADHGQIAEIHERGLMLSVTREELHDPRQESGRRRVGVRETTLENRLRRALDWLARR
jgi:hypothetical protein